MDGQCTMKKEHSPNMVLQCNRCDKVLRHKVWIRAYHFEASNITLEVKCPECSTSHFLHYTEMQYVSQ